MLDPWEETSRKGPQDFIPPLNPCYIPSCDCLFLLCLTVFIVSTCLSPNVAEAFVPESSRTCMTCHKSQGLFTVFKSTERMSVFVKEADFNNSVHIRLNCRDCHKRISQETHPGRVPESKKAFDLETSQECLNCHAGEKIKTKRHHALVIESAEASRCVVCHGSHGVKGIASLKKSLSVNDYCLACHRQKIRKTHKSGEILSLLIDPSNLAASVHNRHSCKDCHVEYSREVHPIQVFETGREHAVAVSELCRKCHEDKFALLAGSIHYKTHFSWGEKLINTGDIKVPVCTDCHGFHTVGPKDAYETLSGLPCRKCHEDIFRIYAKSVHGMAKARGEHKAPICSSCHFAHDVKFTAMTDRIKKACIGCHENAEASHKKWLPNAELHLGSVACAACHAPSSGKGIYLQLIDDQTGRPFTDAEIASLLGSSYEELSERLNAHGEGIDSYELSFFLRQLNKKNADARVTYVGRMDVSRYSDAHQLSLKKNAVKECESCHRKDSQFFRKITLAVVRADGSMKGYSTKPDVLESIISARALKEFYVLGGTRLTLLDWIGIAIVLGGIIFPVVHMFARIVTLPVRRTKKPDEQKREETK